MALVAIVYVLTLYSLWPIVLGVAILALLALLKASRPLLQPLLSLLLMRLYESERGVLTQVAIGLGAVAKIVQEIVKSA